MKRFKDISIKYKMLLIIMLISTIILFIASTAFVTYNVVNFRKNIASQLLTVAKIIGANNTASVIFMDSEAAKESLSSLKANINIITACVFLPNGDLLSSYVREDIKTNNSFPIVQKDTLIFGKNYLDVFQTIALNNEPVGVIYIRSDLNELYDNVKKMIGIVASVLLSSLIVAFIISAKLQRIISTPILKLANIASKVSVKKDYSIRMKRKGWDEIGKLFACFNEMLTQIEKQNKELTEAKRIAENSVKAKELFLANMSHEIRTPMNAIMGIGQLMNKTPLNQEQEKYLDIIQKSGNNLLNIINDILDVSKIRSGKFTMESIGFRIEEVLNTVASAIAHKAEQKGITLSHTIEDNAKRIFIGDPTRLHQILMNLINNAIKFTDEGEVKIEVKVTGESEKELTATFYVCDSGIGISEDKLDLIFGSFNQADTNTTRKYGGTGLGLTICKSLVELQKGKISVISTPGKGSRFSFYIPYLKGEEKDMLQNDNDTLVKISSHEKILLVEDNQFNQFFIVKMLEDSGFLVDVADHGKRAIEMIGAKDYDIILMDIQMPGMGGLEATKIIRNELPDPKCNVPIIALTANAIKGDDQLCYEAGMNDYLSKPFNFADLYKKIMKHCKNKLHDNSQEVPKKEITVPKNSTAECIDLTQLKVISGGSREFMLKMIRTFIEQASTDVGKMQQYLSKKDWNALSAVAHKMRASFQFLGIRELQEPIKKIENFAKESPNRKFLPELVSKVSAVFKSSLDELNREAENLRV